MSQKQRLPEVSAGDRTATANLQAAAQGGECQLKIGGDWRLPAYLQTRFMVVRTGTNEIHFAEFDRWAEPLDGGVSRVLKDSLGSARNAESAALDSHAEDMLDYEFKIRILACEGARGERRANSLRFAMAWELRSVGTNAQVMKHGAFAASPATWDGNEYERSALGLSQAIAAAGKALATDLPTPVMSADKANLEATKPRTSSWVEHPMSPARAATYHRIYELPKCQSRQRQSSQEIQGNLQ